jgi:hypothetical protein
MLYFATPPFENWELLGAITPEKPRWDKSVGTDDHLIEHMRSKWHISYVVGNKSKRGTPSGYPVGRFSWEVCYIHVIPLFINLVFSLEVIKNINTDAFTGFDRLEFARHIALDLFRCSLFFCVYSCWCEPDIWSLLVALFQVWESLLCFRWTSWKSGWLGLRVSSDGIRISWWKTELLKRIRDNVTC